MSEIASEKLPQKVRVEVQPSTELAKIDQPKVIAEQLIDIDDMYRYMGKTLSALSNTTVDGDSTDDIDAQLQAHARKDLIPDTEIEMLHTLGVPMSKEDVDAFNTQQSRMQSVQYRKEQLKIPTMTLAEITGARVRVAYRLLRYMAHIRGRGGVGIPLIFSLGSSDPQINLFEMPLPYDPTVGWYRGLAAVRNLLAQATEGSYTYTYILGDGLYYSKGMSILPPPLHDGYFPGNGTPVWEYRRRQHTPKDYDAERDAPLAIYLNICELLVRLLDIGYENVKDQAAIAALLNPKIARLAWPCRDDIETFEEYVLLPYVGRILVDRAQNTAIDELKKEMHLTHSEAYDLIETYKTYAQHADVNDPERERPIMLNKLDKLAETCDNAAMVTTQLNTYKTKLQVLGLTRHEEDTNIDKREGLQNVLEAEIVKEKTDKEAKELTSTED